MCTPIERPSRPSAFTMVELLVVLSVLGVLAALFFPSLVSARHAADRARTRLRFGQWMSAIEAFRTEYGSYPVFAADGLVNGGAAASPDGEHLFHDLLAGRRRDGLPLGTGPAGSAAGQNFRGVRFHAFGEDELTSGEGAQPCLVRVASGETSIAVVVDRNLDGRIDALDLESWPAVAAADGLMLRPGPSDLPAGGLRAGVAFYAPDPSAPRGQPRLVRSW